MSPRRWSWSLEKTDGLRLEYIQDTVKRQAIVYILVASSDYDYDEPSVETDVDAMGGGLGKQIEER